MRKFTLKEFLQKAQFKQEWQKRGGKTEPEEFDKAIKYILSPASQEFVIGKPMLFRLEMKNIGEKPIGYWRTEVLMNDPMLVTDPNGRVLPCVDAGGQLFMSPDAILSGEVIVLGEAYDVTSQYRILHPGRYRFQWRFDSRTSNVCEVDVKPGTPPDMEQIVDKLLSVLPAGWRWTRSLTPRSGVREDDTAKTLYVTLVGKPGGFGNPYEMTLLILMGDDPADADAWLKESFDLWGVTSWGPVYARVNKADQLWPDHRAEITRVLGINKAP